MNIHIKGYDIVSVYDCGEGVNVDMNDMLFKNFKNPSSFLVIRDDSQTMRVQFTKDNPEGAWQISSSFPTGSSIGWYWTFGRYIDGEKFLNDSEPDTMFLEHGIRGSQVEVPLVSGYPMFVFLAKDTYTYIMENDEDDN